MKESISSSLSPPGTSPLLTEAQNLDQRSQLDAGPEPAMV